METKNALVVFQGKRVRRTLHNNEWYFAVVDIVQALTDSVNPSDYLKKLKQRDESLNEGWGQIVTPLLIDTQGGPQSLNCANTEGAFRIIQSIPSKKAEPFKRWLAKVGYERVQEIENPELAKERNYDFNSLTNLDISSNILFLSFKFFPTKSTIALPTIAPSAPAEITSLT